MLHLIAKYYCNRHSTNATARAVFFQLLVSKFRYFCFGYDGTARFIELLLCAMFFVLCAMCYCMILVSRCNALDFNAI
ncbi:hypothetical protein M0804_014352 [Polistes exclamans]|nr:hypothetical protein M0804_014352 [Polistes exclamans]